MQGERGKDGRQGVPGCVAFLVLCHVVLTVKLGREVLMEATDTVLCGTKTREMSKSLAHNSAMLQMQLKWLNKR